MKTEKHSLSCELTDHELVQKGEEIVALYKANSGLDMNKKRLSAAIKHNDEDIEKLLEVVDQKQEHREVWCVWVWFWEMGTKKLVRLDTFTVVRAEVIKEWERQGKLDDYPEDSPSEIDLMIRKIAEADELPEQAETEKGQEVSVCQNKECSHYDSVCQNKECSHYDAAEPNGCVACENVYECDQCSSETEEKDCNNGEKTKAKFISSRINQLEKAVAE